MSIESIVAFLDEPAGSDDPMTLTVADLETTMEVSFHALPTPEAITALVARLQFSLAACRANAQAATADVSPTTATKEQHG